MPQQRVYSHRKRILNKRREYWYIKHKQSTAPDICLHVFIVGAQRITFQIQFLYRASFKRIQLTAICQLRDNKTTVHTDRSLLDIHCPLSGQFPGKPIASPSSVFFLHSLWKRTLADKCQVLYNALLSLTNTVTETGTQCIQALTFRVRHRLQICPIMHN